jgi:hypothetical protein
MVVVVRGLVVVVVVGRMVVVVRGLVVVVVVAVTLGAAAWVESPA